LSWEELDAMMANEPSWPPADMEPVMALMAKYDTFPPPAASQDGSAPPRLPPEQNHDRRTAMTSLKSP
jgi:hypothetical protein